MSLYLLKQEHILKQMHNLKQKVASQKPILQAKADIKSKYDMREYTFVFDDVPTPESNTLNKTLKATFQLALNVLNSVKWF